MTFLALDTSGDYAVLALASDEGVVEAVSLFQGRRTLSRRLMGQIEALLSGSGLTVSDMTAFAVGIGPGSFTGVRVGVTTAKTLAQVLHKPLVGIGTLEAYAADWEKSESLIVPILPSRRGEAYAAVFESGQMREAPFAERIEQLIVRLESLHECESLIVCGEASLLPPGRCPALQQSFVPPEGLARLAARRLQIGEYDDPLALTPLYVVPPSISTPRSPAQVLGSGTPG
jgi:tRNA threonylcarbamoyladenosine biosynthesis protein TsaB